MYYSTYHELRFSASCVCGGGGGMKAITSTHVKSCLVSSLTMQCVLYCNPSVHKKCHVVQSNHFIHEVTS